MPGETDFKHKLRADIDGFSLHAALRCGADDRPALEHPCRCSTRPALANERVRITAAGQVVLELVTAWRHGVLAPNARRRAMVVPQEPAPHHLKQHR